jgi:hypothetical protein
LLTAGASAGGGESTLELELMESPDAFEIKQSKGPASSYEAGAVKSTQPKGKQS